MNTIETVINSRMIAMSMKNVMRMKEIKSIVRMSKMKMMAKMTSKTVVKVSKMSRGRN